MLDELKKSVCANRISSFERQNYYFGKMMTKRDFQDEQRYFNEKRWVLNRYGIGWGVLCGLKVTHGEKIDCTQQSQTQNPSRLSIAPGFALDMYGHEIMVCEPFFLDLRSLLKDYLDDLKNIEENQEKTCYLSIRYQESPSELTQVPADCTCSCETDCVHNRIREHFKFAISFEEHEWLCLLNPPIKDSFGCNIDCFNFLENPCQVIIDRCPDSELCKEIPLAKIRYSIIKDECIGLIPEIIEIDNCDHYRKLAYSNDTLFHLIKCLKHELWKTHAAKYDRKRFVPLLSQTIKGVNYTDGKIKTIKGVGRHPKRVTTDGKHVWVTDQEDTNIFRIDQKSSEPKNAICKIDLNHKSWGIAFDGHYMWVSHPENGTLSGVNICDPDNIDNSRKEVGHFRNPREVLYDGKNIWVSHDASDPVKTDYIPSKTERQENIQTVKSEFTGKSTTLVLSRINTVTAEIEATYLIYPKECSPTTAVISMAYDGDNIWIAFGAYGGKYNATAVMKLNFSDKNPDISGGPNNMYTYMGDAFTRLQGNNPEDIVFDGTHIWVTHNEGATKIDLNYEDFWSTRDRTKQTAVAFDGSSLWTAEVGDKEARINKTDILQVRQVGGEEIVKIFEGKYEISKICFDGTYLWVAAFEETDKQSKKGVIHRLLP